MVLAVLAHRRTFRHEAQGPEPSVCMDMISPAVTLGAVCAALKQCGFKFFQCKACEAMGNKVKLIRCIGKDVENAGVLFVESKHGNGASGMSNSDETSTVKNVHCLPGKQEGIIMRQHAIDFIPVCLPEIEADVFEV